MTKLFSAPLWSLVIRWFADVLAYAPIPEQTLPLRLAFKALLQYQSNSSLQQVFHTKPLVQPWYAEKVAEKNEQHEKLVDMLKMYGYDVYLRPMPLGMLAQSTTAIFQCCKILDFKEQWLKEY